MYVGVKQTVIDRIAKRLAEIRRDNREPEYVAVTHEEYHELRSDRRSYDVYYSGYGVGSWVPTGGPIDSKATITTRDFERRAYRPGDWREQRYYRVPQNGTFMGVPLFVVPPEFMPS